MGVRYFTAGYLGHRVEDLIEAAEHFGAVVVDIRIQPQSRLPMWRQKALQRVLGDTYVWCGNWGSPTFKSGPPHTILGFDAGLAQVEALNQTAILLCACRDYRACHRRVLAERLQHEFDWDISELEW